MALFIGLMALIGRPPAPALALTGDAPDSTVQFPITPVGNGTIGGVALLTPSQDGGTAVQLLVAGAPEGTFAVIHPGSCEESDPRLVALLGDVGAGASLQVTVPLDIDVLTDGAHVLALHEGLGFATTLACGSIPASGGPEAEASPAPASSPLTGGSYTSPRYGFSVAWDQTWQPVADTPPEGVDRISLDHGASTLDIAGYRGQAGDAAACIAAWEDDLFAGVRDGSVRNLAPLLGADGSRLAGGDTAHAWAAYRYLLDPLTVETADYRECWSLPDGALVELGQVAFVDDFAAEALARDAVVETLMLPEAPLPLTPAPEPTPSPVPTADPECVGVPAWVDATRARLDRIVDLQAEADAFIGDGDVDGYVASVGAFAGEIRALLAQQETELVPDIARSANEEVITTFGHYIEAGETLYRHITVSASPGLYERFLDAIKAANEGAGKVRSQLGDLAGECPEG